jgi:hypothetical protein
MNSDAATAVSIHSGGEPISDHCDSKPEYDACEIARVVKTFVRTWTTRGISLSNGAPPRQIDPLLARTRIPQMSKTKMLIPRDCMSSTLWHRDLKRRRKSKTESRF